MSVAKKENWKEKKKRQWGFLQPQHFFWMTSHRNVLKAWWIISTLFTGGFQKLNLTSNNILFNFLSCFTVYFIDRKLLMFVFFNFTLQHRKKRKYKTCQIIISPLQLSKNDLTKIIFHVVAALWDVILFMCVEGKSFSVTFCSLEPKNKQISLQNI